MYAYLFGVKDPPSHVMGFFISILRERIAKFEAPSAGDDAEVEIIGISINDLRKNLRMLNDVMDKEVFDQPGLYSMWPRIGLKSLLVPVLGKRYVLDLRIDQTYLRSQPVNSEEGAPMGIGVWYEMYISNPTDYLFKNRTRKARCARTSRTRPSAACPT